MRGGRRGWREGGGVVEGVVVGGGGGAVSRQTVWWGVMQTGVDLEEEGRGRDRF